MPIMLFQCLDLFYSQQIIFSKKIGNRVYKMSSLLPIFLEKMICCEKKYKKNVITVTSHVCSKYQVTQYSAVAFIYRFEGWCLQVHIAENEDTLPTISERIFDFMCLKTRFSCKITNY